MDELVQRVLKAQPWARLKDSEANDEGFDGNAEAVLDKLIMSDTTCRELWAIAVSSRGSSG